MSHLCPTKPALVRAPVGSPRRVAGRRLALPLALALATPFASASAAAYTFTSTYGVATGINDRGQVVGSTSAGGYVQDLTSGAVIPLPQRGFSSSGAGINNNGLVTEYANVSGGTLIFIVDPPTGTLTPLPSQGGLFASTYPNGINDSNQVVGYATVGYHSNIAERSFLYDPSTGITTVLIDPATGSASGYMTAPLQVGYTEARDINDRGQVVGGTLTPTATSNGVYVPTGFLLDLATGTYTAIVVPGATATTAYGINDVGQVVGSYDSAGTTNGFVLDLATGRYTTLDDPDPSAISTTLFGINDAGQIVGDYSVASGARAGFVATPSVATAVPEPDPLSILGGAVALALVGRRRRA